MKVPSSPKKSCPCALASKFFDADARNVYLRLAKCSKETYFVGGCVRDILLGLKPKDFDLVTSARPNQIRRLFKNSRIVGKRFRLVHVFFEGKIVEVATFRGMPSEEEESPGIAMLPDDNVYGTLEEDVWRRDFTINGLYYDYLKSKIIDYVGGIQDLHLRKIHAIGNPDVRFQEDPVRILRAVKFAARLNFSIEPRDREAIECHRHLLSQVPSARILLEMTKILQEGNACRCFEEMNRSGIVGSIAPGFQDSWGSEDSPQHEIFFRFLGLLDRTPSERRCRFSEAALFSAICFPLVVSPKFFSESRKNGKMSLSRSKLKSIAAELSLPRRTLERVEQILAGQIYLEMGESLPVARQKKIADKEYFQDALDLLDIRTGEDPRRETYQFWEKYSERARRG